MSTPQISVQLYSVRNEMRQDAPATLAKVAQMGYRHVEPAGTHGLAAKDLGKALRDAGVKATSWHAELPLGDKRNQVIEDTLAIGAKYIITGGPAGGWPGNWAAVDTLKAEADLYNQAAAIAAPHGLLVGFHNHELEMTVLDGQPAYRHFLKHLAPEVLWTVDAYWAKVGECDPTVVLKDAGKRNRIVHIKDGPLARKQPMVALGEGKLDIPPIVKSAKFAEFLCVELDLCATDMLTALGKSYQYLERLVG